MKLNISYPTTGAQKLIEVDDEKKVRPFYDKRMGFEMPADALGDEWKVIIYKIVLIVFIEILFRLCTRLLKKAHYKSGMWLTPCLILGSVCEKNDFRRFHCFTVLW